MHHRFATLDVASALPSPSPDADEVKSRQHAEFCALEILGFDQIFIKVNAK